MPFAARAKDPIAILATPKTGNLWVKYVLVNAFDMTGQQFFQTQDVIDYFSDNGADRRIVFHAHLPYGTRLRDTLKANKIRTISLVRNPLDIFLSLRSHVSRLGAGSAAQADILSNDPATLRDFAQTFFLGDLAISAGWVRHDAILVRYEDMLADPLDAFADLGRKLDLDAADIEAFASVCARMSDIQELRVNAQPADQAHFTSAEIDKWKRPEHEQIVSILLECPPIRTALQLWGYSDNRALAEMPAG